MYNPLTVPSVILCSCPLVLGIYLGGGGGGWKEYGRGIIILHNTAGVRAWPVA